MGEKKRRSPAQAVQDALQRVYDRHGPRGLLLTGYITVSVAAFGLGAVLVLTGSRYADLPFDEAVPWAASSGVAAAVMIWAGQLLARDSQTLLLSWSGPGRVAERAPEVWNATIRHPRVITVRTCLAMYALLATIGLPLGITGWDLSWSGYLPSLLGWANLLAAAGVAVTLYLDLLVKPMLADVAAFLPPDFVPSASTMSLRTKAILPVPGLVIFTGLILAAVLDTDQGYTGLLLQSITITIAISVIAVAIYYVLAHAFLDPVDGLMQATHRVGAGDLDTRVPVVSSDELGALAVSFNQMMIGLQEREVLRSHNAELTGRLEQSLEDVRASRARIVAAADDERRRVERDLHDGAQQRLVMISLKVAMAADLLEKDPGALRPLLDELRADASRAVEELRDLAHGIYPPLLESDGLASALEDVADQSAFPVEIDTAGTSRYPAQVEAAVYFCCIEALQNAAKHAGPGSRARIMLEAEDGVLRFAVADDGQGFDVDELNGSTGLQNMRDRIGALGGSVRVASAPGQGTTVEGTVPVR